MRPAVPVLAGVLIDAGTDGTVTLSAFDYEVSARITVSAEVSEPGTVLVLGRLLSDISRNLPADKPVDVSTDGSKVLVNCGSSRFALLQMPASDYPTPADPARSSGTIDGATFTQAVSQVAIAADRGDTLPILTGVRVEIEGERSPSGHRPLPARHARVHVESQLVRRLAYRAHPGQDPLGDGAFARSGGSVAIALGSAAGGDRLVGFEADQRHSTSRLLDGEYPKVAKIFPSSSEIEAVVKTADLIETVKRVALVAERNTPVRLRFSQGQVDIEAGTGDDAQASEAVEARLDGADIDVAFNPAFLLDGLGHSIRPMPTCPSRQR